MIIELKVGQVVKFRNGETGEVVKDKPECSKYDIVVKHHDDDDTYDYTWDGMFFLDGNSNYDVVEIIEDN